MIEENITVGLVGYGVWGSAIVEALSRIAKVTLKWTAGADDWWKQESVDWAVISSPNIFHFEQTKEFLEHGINVFCEKPAALSSELVEKLYELAHSRGVRLYINDILSYGNGDWKRQKYVWKKSGRLNSNIWDRLAYHHFYLIERLQMTPIRCEWVVNSKWEKNFKIVFQAESHTTELSFDYQIYRTEGEHEHNIDSDGSELQKMLESVLYQTADFERNRSRSTFATFMCAWAKEQMEPKVAVIGAGIYGVTSAIAIADAGFRVCLQERHLEILREASGINQYRVHRGYHYPRSKTTIEACIRGSKEFEKMYSRSLLQGHAAHYSIAANRSKVDVDQFRKIMDNYGLAYRGIREPLQGCNATFLVEEKLYSITILRSVCKNRLKAAGIHVELGTSASAMEASELFDQVVVTTYRETNAFRKEKKTYQFELCEKPVFRIPSRYAGEGWVVLDGPFMCFDPWEASGFHVAGNVEHAIHLTCVGDKMDIPEQFIPLMNRGLIAGERLPPGLSKASQFISSAKEFFPGIEESIHIGSMFVIRVVLPDREETDERPTVIDQEENRLFIVGGKVCGCVDAANTAVSHCCERYGVSGRSANRFVRSDL